MANMINAHFVIISMPVSMSKLSIRSQIVCEVKGLDYDKHIVIVFVYLPDLLRQFKGAPLKDIAEDQSHTATTTTLLHKTYFQEDLLPVSNACITPSAMTLCRQISTQIQCVAPSFSLEIERDCITMFPLSCLLGSQLLRGRTTGIYKILVQPQVKLLVTYVRLSHKHNVFYLISLLRIIEEFGKNGGCVADAFSSSIFQKSTPANIYCSGKSSIYLIITLFIVLQVSFNRSRQNL